jgi:hypothetical protein
MAGILANSLSRQMTDGDTAPVNVVQGYVGGQLVTLATTPTGSTYQWALSCPNTSSRTRPVALSDTQGAAPTFTPDVAGFYVVTCVVDGVTAYTLTLDVLTVVNPVSLLAILEQQVSDVAIPSPPGTALTIYNSEEQGGLAYKDSSGTVTPLSTGTSSQAITGPTGATDNALVRFNGTSGTIAQNSLVTVDDSGNVSVPALATVDGVDVSVLGAKLASGYLFITASLTTGTTQPLSISDALMVGQSAGGAAVGSGGTAGLVAGTFASDATEQNTASGHGGLGSSAASTQPYDATDFPGGHFACPILKSNGADVFLKDIRSDVVIDTDARVYGYLAYRSDLGANLKWRLWFYYRRASDGFEVPVTPDTSLTNVTLRVPQVALASALPTAAGLAGVAGLGASQIAFGVLADLQPLGTAAVGTTGRAMDAGTVLPDPTLPTYSGSFTSTASASAVLQNIPMDDNSDYQLVVIVDARDTGTNRYIKKSSTQWTRCAGGIAVQLGIDDGPTGVDEITVTGLTFAVNGNSVDVKYGGSDGIHTRGTYKIFVERGAFIAAS